MKASYIAYANTHAFSGIVNDYLTHAAILQPFYSYEPSIAGFEKLLNKRNIQPNRALLVNTLLKQYKEDSAIQLADDSLVKHHIHLLKQDGTYTITTGHQLNIFTGPLYFIYKIVTAINLAKELKQQFPDKDFVPVYWMATEDHDFAEINHIKVEDKKLSWDANASGATGRIKTKSIAETVAAYKGFLGISENGIELGKLIEKAYLEHDNLADATRYLVHELFGKHGLVIIDANEPALKREFIPIIERDITQENSFKLITHSSAQLENAGYKPQVNPREINFFYMTDGLRERIVKEGDHYEVLNTTIKFTAAELQAEINAHPEHFSPNVVMRPLYQEVILPNIAYIGGGAEVTYWLQLRSTFEHYGIDFPVLMLRNSAMVVDEKTYGRLNRLDIKLEEVFASTEVLKSTWVKTHSEHNLTLDDELRALYFLFEQLKLKAYKIEKTLGQATETVRAKSERLVKNLEQKLVRAEKRKYGSSLEQIDKVKLSLFPDGVLQERKLNIAPFYIKYGHCFIDALVEHFKPLDFLFTIIHPD